MNNKVSNIRGIVIIVLTIWSLILWLFIIVVGISEYFIYTQLELWQFIGVIVYGIIQLLISFVVFRYFLIKKIYKIEYSNQTEVVFITQFKKIIVKKRDILSKRLGIFNIYKLKVKCNKNIKTFFVKYDIGKSI